MDCAFMLDDNDNYVEPSPEDFLDEPEDSENKEKGPLEKTPSLASSQCAALVVGLIFIISSLSWNGVIKQIDLEPIFNARLLPLQSRLTLQIRHLISGKIKIGDMWFFAIFL